MRRTHIHLSQYKREELRKNSYLSRRHYHTIDGQLCCQTDRPVNRKPHPHKADAALSSKHFSLRR